MCEQLYNSGWLAGFCIIMSKIRKFTEAVRVEQKIDGKEESQLQGEA
jgi:hypothetical protein